MSTSDPILRIGERIEKLDMAIFSGSPGYWRYPACIIRRIKVDRSGTHLWFKMKNISLDDPGGKAPAFLFCYNKQFNFYVTVEGDAFVSGLAGDLKTPQGWQDPLFANQTTYLIRMDIRHASTFYRAASAPTASAPATAAPPGRTSLFPDRSFLPHLVVNKSPKFNWASFLTGMF
ncbi:MAG TPA: hypothetical protein VL978_12175 [Puia sp.]|nr:hypothetical protein [Puia sp.]